MTSLTSSATPRANLTLTVASGDALDIREFRVEEALSSLFEVHLVALCDNADLDFDGIVGQPASFALLTDASGLAAPRRWTGICNRLQQIGVEEAGLSTYELSLVPALWLLTQRRNYRMFQQISEPDIVRQLLGEWEITPEVRFTGTYKKRKYRVQYGESDYALLCRMLEDAGISFYFEEGEATRLVLSDAPQAIEARAATLPYREHPTAADREHVTRVRLGKQVRPGRYTMRDHDYRRQPANQPLASAAEGEGVEGRLERYHYTPGAFLFGADKGEDTPAADDRGKTRTDDAEGALLAQKRLEAKRASAKRCTFETNAHDLAPGMVVAFCDHPRADLGPGRPLLIVQSTLSGRHDGEWTHVCEARSAEAPYRPAVKTPKPKVSGVESATVVGPPGEEIHCDEFGRARVHFHWDRESRMDDKSSCWIPVSQPWAGTGYGGVSLPRVGQEVIVDFLGGDPDRPIIVGRVYTNLQKVPFGLPANKTQSGWKSNSTQGTGGYNEIMFEDVAGKELVRVQAERDLNKLVKNDETVTIGNDRTKNVGRDDSLTVGNDRTKMIGGSERNVIGLNQSVAVGVNRATQVGRIDSTMVGERHSILVMEPGEGGGDCCTAITSTSSTVTIDIDGGPSIKLSKAGATYSGSPPVASGSAIELNTGAGALIKLEGSSILLTASSISINSFGAGGTAITASGGDVKITGGPMVRINS
jgi:type VI secretion system secreted protein VgrG